MCHASERTTYRIFVGRAEGERPCDGPELMDMSTKKLIIGFLAFGSTKSP